MPVVLVIEDDPHLQLLYRDELTEAGYRVLTARDTDEAFATVAREPLDVIILDLCGRETRPA